MILAPKQAYRPAPVPPTLDARLTGGAIYVDIDAQGRFKDLRFRESTLPAGCTRLVFRHTATVRSVNEEPTQPPPPRAQETA